MKKYLITGFAGFVSNHMLAYLNTKGVKTSVLGVDTERPQFPLEEYSHLDCDFKALNLLDRKALQKVIYDFKLEYMLHFAAFSSVGLSWLRPVESFNSNTNVFLNLVDSVRQIGRGCRILAVGSSEEYGDVSRNKLPLQEQMQLYPVSPYGVARLAQEHLSRVYVDSYGLDIVMTRSFNHIGPGQKEIFVVSSFVKQIVEIRKRRLVRGKLRAGDVSIVRDFLDVRDVVVAYERLLDNGVRGEVYNVCSDIGVSLEEVIKLISEAAGVSVEIELDTKLIRPADNKIVIGSNEKLRSATGWTARIPLRGSLNDTIEYWSQRLE